jgi:hypothetical protein
MNETWQALTNEAQIAVQHIAIGVTALSKANYAQQAYYSQAFLLFLLVSNVQRSLLSLSTMR